MTTFIESIELPNACLILKRIKSGVEDIFGESDGIIEETTLIKCAVLKVGLFCKNYKEGDVVLVKANHLRPILYTEDVSTLKVVYNEDLIFCKINE